jgi:PAS domain S-box-containing protein
MPTDDRPGGKGITPETFETYFDELPCYVTVQDRDLRILAANRLFRNDFGGRSGALCHKIYTGSDTPCPRCPVARTFEDGKIHRTEKIVRRKDGTEKTVIAFSSPIRDERGRIAAVEEISADITEVKALQRKLHESRERYRLLFEEVPCYISIQDRDLRIVEANRAFQNDFGDHAVGHCYEIYKHRDEPCEICPVMSTFKDGTMHQSEEVVTSKSGETINVLVSAAPLRNSDGEIEQVMEMSANITDVRQLQDQLTSLGLLVGSISHGIKGLLTGLDGGMYIMETGLEREDMERIRKGWDMIQRNVVKVRSMVLDVLYYAKDREPEWDTLDAQAIAREVADVIEPKARESGVAFEREFDPGAGRFDGDQKAISSMLVNLLENSLDACRTDRAKDEHAIRFGVSRRGDEMIFEVTDNGVGMDQETQEKAFSLFFSSKGMEGTGLGLFISHRIALKHGGSIDLTSRLGQGTHFTVRIPVERSTPAPVAEITWHA